MLLSRFRSVPVRRILQTFPAAAASLLFLAAGAAGAQDQAATQTFLSPMGEPFRAPAGKPYPSDQWFAGADANHDGSISREEFRADAARFFKLLDADSDGKISDREVSYYEYRVAPEVVAAAVDTSGTKAPKNADDDRPKNIPLANVRQGAAFYSWLNDAEPLRSADIDFNRKVTPEEWKAAADRKFALLDPDGTGSIKLADMPLTPIQAAALKKR